jgi:hypothetical protein
VKRQENDWPARSFAGTLHRFNPVQSFTDLTQRMHGLSLAHLDNFIVPIKITMLCPVSRKSLTEYPLSFMNKYQLLLMTHA